MGNMGKDGSVPIIRCNGYYIREQVCSVTGDDKADTWKKASVKREELQAAADEIHYYPLYNFPG